MSKRELGHLNSAAELDGPRAKKRKEPSAGDVTMSDPDLPGTSSGQANGVVDDAVVQQGLALWHIIKNAVNKEGRVLSEDFLHRPPKRQYPDYYLVIKQPIALEDVKKQIEAGGYQSLENVKEALDLCFSNAKQYNMKDSVIWKDARQLQKLVGKEYIKMTGEEEPVDIVEEDGAEKVGDADMDEGEGRKKRGKTKAPNMNRLLKSRLSKLTNKTDDSGRVLSTEFMELPSKKDWPGYYKVIKRPQCFENIFKHIKRKEYHTPAEFATDVELVFSNAMAFNQEHTDIWEDALQLREYFRHLMSDLPSPFSLPEYSKPSNGKIRLKMSSTTQLTATSSSPSAPPAANTPGSLTLRVPGGSNAADTSQAAPSFEPQMQNHLTGPTSKINHTPLSKPTPQAARQSTPLQAHSLPVARNNAPTPPLPATQSLLYSTGYSQHYPNASYQASLNASLALVNNTSATATHSNHSYSNSPAPPIHPLHQIKCVLLTTDPRGRPFRLDHRDGVKSWALKCGTGEKAVYISDVTFVGDDADEMSSDGEEEQEWGDPDKEADLEEVEDIEVDVPAKPGRKKGKQRGRGRPKGHANKVGVKAKVVNGVKKKKVHKREEIQVKLNGKLIEEIEEHPGKWHVELPTGSNVIEVGEKGGMFWNVYADRTIII